MHTLQRDSARWGSEREMGSRERKSCRVDLHVGRSRVPFAGTFRDPWKRAGAHRDIREPASLESGGLRRGECSRKICDQIEHSIAKRWLHKLISCFRFQAPRDSIGSEPPGFRFYFGDKRFKEIENDRDCFVD